MGQQKEGRQRNAGQHSERKHKKRFSSGAADERADDLLQLCTMRQCLLQTRRKAWQSRDATWGANSGGSSDPTAWRRGVRNDILEHTEKEAERSRCPPI